MSRDPVLGESLRYRRSRADTNRTHVRQTCTEQQDPCLNRTYANSRRTLHGPGNRADRPGMSVSLAAELGCALDARFCRWLSSDG